GRLTTTQPTTSENEDDHLDKAVYQAAIIYTWAISSAKPMSAFDGELRHGLLVSVQSVRLSRWKQIPGIYLWIVLVACSGAKDDMLGHFWRRKVSVATASIGFSNFPLAISCLRSFSKVQKWLSDGPHARAEPEVPERP